MELEYGKREARMGMEVTNDGKCTTYIGREWEGNARENI